jgi:uncharacterized protein YecE (DUF72 family)
VLFVGTSGWQYAHWRERFYPRGVAQRRWLEWFSQRFQTVELNSSFYRLPAEAAFEGWREGTPDDFRFAVKMSRFLTHIKRLRDPQEPVRLFLSRAERLGPKLGPVLVQLPPGLEGDPDRLDTALSCFPRRVRVAVEFRDASWFSGTVREVLQRHEAALCLGDGAGVSIPMWRTADWGFVRFHWGGGTPEPCYPRDSLRRWAGRLAETWPARADVFAYFNNDQLGCAVRDAAVFAEEAMQAGLSPTRVPTDAHVS